MTDNFAALLAVAREYCDLIESAGKGDGHGWLRRVERLLPRLHAAISIELDEARERNAYFIPNLETRFELFSKLRKLLGEKDAYWMEFDVALEDEHKSGSLADDLTDIYCELKSGLARLDSDEQPSCIQHDWLAGYRLHWGKHLVDAERHLYELASRNALAV